MEKKKVLFVGSFKKEAKDGSVGGQMFACKVITNSSISDSVSWTLLDTTADSNILSSSFIRIVKALKRLATFTYHLFFARHDFFLIFTGGGWSFWEKGLMSILAKTFSNGKVILAPRSGYIIEDMSARSNLSKFIRYVFEKVDIIVCQSEYWKNLFQNYSNAFQNDKFVIIENVVDFDKYGFLPIRQGENGEDIKILFMAWVIRNKGIFELIEATNLLRKEGFNFQLIIAGKGGDLEDIKGKIGKSGMEEFIQLIGWVRNDAKLNILRESDIFVLPSYFEGYPNSLIEAMAAGKSCIATKVGAIPDLIKNFENGILIDEKNISQLYEGLKLLIKNPKLRHTIACNARKHVEKNNSMERGISKFTNLFS